MADKQNLAESSQSNGLGYVAPSSASSGTPVDASSSTKKVAKKDDDLEIRIEFGGGLHLLFSSKPRHTIHIPRYMPNTEPPQQTNMRYLIKYLKTDVLSEREEMFGEGDSVRPGILVLVNDADWELEGEGDYILQDRDESAESAAIGPCLALKLVLRMEGHPPKVALRGPASKLTWYTQATYRRDPDLQQYRERRFYLSYGPGFTQRRRINPLLPTRRPNPSLFRTKTEMSETQLGILARSGLVPTVCLHAYRSLDGKSRKIHLVACAGVSTTTNVARALTFSDETSPSAEEVDWKATVTTVNMMLELFGQDLLERVGIAVADTPGEGDEDAETMWNILQQCSTQSKERFDNPGYKGNIPLKAVLVDKTTWNTLNAVDRQVNGFDVYSGTNLDLFTDDYPGEITRGRVTEAEE